MRTVIAAALISLGAPLMAAAGWVDAAKPPSVDGTQHVQAGGDGTGPVCADPCVWRVGYGDRANLFSDQASFLLAGATLLPSGNVFVSGTRFASFEQEVWLALLDRSGREIWNAHAPGLACAAVPAGEGGAILAADGLPGMESVVFGYDGQGEQSFAIGLSFQALNIDPDGAGGFLVSGQLDGRPIVIAYDPLGDRRWTWLGESDGHLALSATGYEDGAVAVLGRGPGEDEDSDVIWLSMLDGGDGSLSALIKIHIAGREISRPCDGVQVMGSVDPLGDGFLVRYNGLDPETGILRNSVAALSRDGTMRWLRETPSLREADLPPPSPNDVEFAEDSVSAVSPTADGGALIAGFTYRPMGRGTPFVARLNDAGSEIWRTELSLAPAGQSTSQAFFATVEETENGGALTVVTDGLELLRLIAFVYSLGPNGEAP
ncbi:MAG: hypothetical protein AAFX92_18225 [Pseudomonadota bacterium]